MKNSLLFSLLALTAWNVAGRAQPAQTAPPLVNDLPFPLVAPAKAQELAVPKPIVLDFDDAPLSTVLDELQKQSGVIFTNYLPGNNIKQLATKLSIHLETPSFERAFREIMGEAGLKGRLQDWGGNGELQLAFGIESAAEKPLQSGVGLFGIELSNLSLTLNKSVDLSNSDAPQRFERLYLNATLTLQSDPRLPIIGSPQTRLARAEDEQGRSLIPQLDENERAQNRINRFGFYGNSSWEQKRATVNLSPAAADAKTLAHLDGVVVYAVVSKTEKWEVPDLLAQPQWTRSLESGGETIAFVVEAALNEDASEGGLKVKIEANSASDEEQSYERIGYPLSQVEPIIKAIRIEDANGMVLRSSGSNSTGGKNIVIRTTFLPENVQVNENWVPAKIQGPLKFVMTAPTEVVQTEVPFSFANVPLP